ncbi:hypothetical protein ON010_g18592 [Phytophthora cinnamomi]|nr:hypothetical protein ON010_g18592 [Phytophthora cinnamomi]
MDLLSITTAAEVTPNQTTALPSRDIALDTRLVAAQVMHLTATYTTWSRLRYGASITAGLSALHDTFICGWKPKNGLTWESAPQVLEISEVSSVVKTMVATQSLTTKNMPPAILPLMWTGTPSQVDGARAGNAAPSLSVASLDRFCGLNNGKVRVRVDSTSRISTVPMLNSVTACNLSRILGIGHQMQYFCIEDNRVEHRQTTIAATLRVGQY